MTLMSSSLFAYEKEYKLFPDKSGVLIYEITGAKEGKVEIKFDDYGQKMTLLSEFDFNGTPNKSKSYVEGDTSFVYDYIREEGYKFVYVDIMQLIALYYLNDDPAKNLRDQYGAKTGTMVGKEKIKGKNCEIWEFTLPAKKIWLWKTYRIKQVYGAEGFSLTTETIKKIKLNAKIPKQEFIKPDMIYDELNFAKPRSN